MSGEGPLVSEGTVAENQCKFILSDYLYSTLKYFYPDETDLCQDDNAPIHRARGVTEWFDEY